jgi:hypothetical protein
MKKKETRLAKPSRSRRRSDGSHIAETALSPDVVPPPAPERRPLQRYEDWVPCSNVFVTFGQLKPSKAGTKTI